MGWGEHAVKCKAQYLYGTPRSGVRLRHAGGTGRASIAVTPGAAFHSLYIECPWVLLASVARFLRVPHLIRVSCDRMFFVLPGCSCRNASPSMVPLRTGRHFLWRRSSYTTHPCTRPGTGESEARLIWTNRPHPTIRLSGTDTTVHGANTRATALHLVGVGASNHRQLAWNKGRHLSWKVAHAARRKFATRRG
jgi:hypothetical protein